MPPTQGRGAFSVRDGPATAADRAPVEDLGGRLLLFAALLPGVLAYIPIPSPGATADPVSDTSA
ncbi:hypothetical protein ACWDA8_43310, partial [Streptomyces sp. NPDC001130]